MMAAVDTTSLPRAEEALAAAAAALAAAGVATPRLDAEVLLAAAWESDRTQLFLRRERELPPPVAAAFHTMVQRRLAREPVAYIVGLREFWSLDFEVDPAVLVPRPETEILVERALVRAMKATPLQICDVGTGSGCVAVTLATERPLARIRATDLSTEALALGRRNAARHGVADAIEFQCSDLLGGDGCFDLVVSNPPYVRQAELEELEPELAWEPNIALDGGEDGLTVVRRLVQQATAALRRGGWLLLEVGSGQAAAVAPLLAAAGATEVNVYPDLAGVERVVEARFADGGVARG